MEQPLIPQQLLDDCHHLGGLAASQLLLHRNASIPWFILVPHTELCDFLDLPAALRQSVLSESAAIAQFIKQELGFDKVNFAALGNVVAAMHLHIIGRYIGDPCWPQPVWGNLPEGEAYSTAQLHDWQHKLMNSVALTPHAL